MPRIPLAAVGLLTLLIAGANVPAASAETLAPPTVPGSAAPTSAQAAQAVERPVHDAPAVRRIRVFVRDDRAVLVVARTGYSTRSKLALNDKNRPPYRVVDAQRAGAVTRTDHNRLQGGPVPRLRGRAAAVLLPTRRPQARAARQDRRDGTRVADRASQRSAGRTFAQTRLRLRMSPIRVSRRTPRSAGATIAQQQQFLPANGWPPEEIFYGTSWTNAVLISVSWTDAPYRPYLASLSPAVPSNWICHGTMLQPSYPVVNSFVDSEGNFEFHGDGSFDRDDGYPCFLDTVMTGKVSPAPIPPEGTVPCSSASLTFTDWNFTAGVPVTLQDMLPLPITFPCLGD